MKFSVGSIALLLVASAGNVNALIGSKTTTPKSVVKTALRETTVANTQVDLPPVMVDDLPLPMEDVAPAAPLATAPMMNSAGYIEPVTLGTNMKMFDMPRKPLQLPKLGAIPQVMTEMYNWTPNTNMKCFEMPKKCLGLPKMGVTPEIKVVYDWEGNTNMKMFEMPRKCLGLPKMGVPPQITVVYDWEGNTNMKMFDMPLKPLALPKMGVTPQIDTIYNWEGNTNMKMFAMPRKTLGLPKMGVAPKFDTVYEPWVPNTNMKKPMPKRPSAKPAMYATAANMPSAAATAESATSDEPVAALAGASSSSDAKSWYFAEPASVYNAGQNRFRG